MSAGEGGRGLGGLAKRKEVRESYGEGSGEEEEGRGWSAGEIMDA